MWRQQIRKVSFAHCAKLFGLWFSVVLTLSSVPAQAKAAEELLLAPVETASPDQGELALQIEDLKKALIALNRDLFILEEDLLFPSSTQVAVYLSLDVGEYFKLDAVELKIDDETVTHYLYTARQVDALSRGGVQKLYVGNVAQGQHEISAFYTGFGPEGRPFKRAVALNFDKGSDAKALELQIIDDTTSQQPKFKAIEL